MRRNADPLDEALRDAAPLAPGALGGVEVRDAIAALVAETRSAVHGRGSSDGSPAGLRSLSSTRRRRRAARTVIASSVLLAAGTGVAAAGGFLGLHTGVFGEPGMTENDTSEYLNGTSPDVAPLMRSYLEETPLAPGYSADRLIERYTSGEQHVVQETGLRAVVFSWSNCSWELAWLEAHASGDAVAEATATDVLTRIPDWPVVSLIDADGGLTASVQRIAEAAVAGDPGPIERETALNCDIDIAR